MLKQLKISTIKVGKRHRKEMGDLAALAESIRDEGLLQPIGVTEDMELVFGERRLRATKEVLKKKTILARIVDVTSILAGEFAENEIRKDFTSSERVAIAKTLEKQLPNRNGVPKARQKIDKLKGQRTDNYVAGKAGFGNHETYRQAAKVVERGSSKLIEAMDEGRVSISAASILAEADGDEQEAILELDERAILQAAKEIRQRKTAARNGEQIAAEAKAKASLNGKRTWKITANQQVVPCDLLLADPPYGITKESWEPEDLEAFTRKWCGKWSACEADFIAIHWSQENMWEGRGWFDESLDGYKFQQMLVWHANNAWSPKSRRRFKESWEPIFLYRKLKSTRQVLPNGRPWGDGLHNLDCCTAPVPESNYTGQDLKQHSCQKPVSVMRWLIHALTEPGEMVCSPFCGVAPCGIAATQLGRHYHGIEIDAEYRRIAKGRIAAYGSDD